MKLILGLLLGLALSLFIKTAYADFEGWTVYFYPSTPPIHAAKFKDGNINCYVATIDSNTWTSPAISCVKVK